MAKLLQEGLVIRRYPEIREAITKAIQQNANTELLFDEDLILGQIVSLLAQEQTVVEQIIQYLFNALDRDKAEGTALDSLLALVGLERLSASKSSTSSMLITTEDDVTISQGYTLENPSTTDRFIVTNTQLISVAACYQVKYKVTSVPVSTQITMNVNGTPYSYTTDASPTSEEIVNGLVAEINGDTIATYVAAPELSEDATETYLVITAGDVLSEINTNILDYLEPLNVSKYFDIEAEISGPIKAPIGTINTPITPQAVISATNTSAIGVGRNRETDTEFRIRAAKSLAVSGSATYAAVLAALLNLPNIGTVLVEENETNTTNALGLPPHSFEAIVTAPDDPATNQLIAKTLWEEKPIGIQTHGNTAVTYTDSTGIDRIIRFSRPASVVIALRITYTLYDEETPTVGLEETLRNICIAYGGSLTSGTDVIPKRFYQDMYKGTTGVEDFIVEAQVLTNSGDTPSAGSWSEARIPIAPSEVSAFSATDISFIQA